MASQSLTDALPDLTVLMRRDGTILDHMGGRGVAALALPTHAAGERLETFWPESAAATVKQLVRRAIAARKPMEASFNHANVAYEARVSAQGPDRAICTLRAALASAASDDPLASTGEVLLPRLDRRGFLRRFQETLSLAALQEKAAAVAVIHLEGIVDIARGIDTKVSEQVLSAAILRIPWNTSAAGGESWWYLGQLNETSLALVMEESDRDAIETLVSEVCASLREPVAMGDAEFHVTPYAGVAILGQDATSPKSLLDHARSASAEARRSGSRQPFFFSDTLRLRSLARLDIAREMRDAIENRDIRLRYVGRHDLATGRLVAQVGYLQWLHPLRGEVRPAEFLSVAESTGLATILSRVVMQGLRDDFSAAISQLDTDAKISFGPLRHHLLQDDFVSDIGRFLADGAVPAARFELRISERTFVALNPSVWESLRNFGIQIVIDEMGRGLGSLDRLARAPIYGVQLDRGWVTALALSNNEVAFKVCRAGISAATALGLTPIATGVDDEEQRRALLELGCWQGSGDLYRDAGRFDTSIMRRTSRTDVKPARRARP
jgi:EAL domain-containing protein (putative c-di-GMP-specific phosphodiesterase class I)/GGDEF domain-containing protein